MAAGYVSLDDTTLKAVLADFAKNGKARVHLGILGGSADRNLPAPKVHFEDFWDKTESGKAAKQTTIGAPNNAEIGAAHEFGIVDKNLPARSWLRMPIITELPSALSVTNKDLWHRVIITKGILGALALLGAYAFDVIQLAFDTGGFGHWAALSKRTIARKGSAAILIDTAQMRQAITAEVFDK
jgi:hypothetical protein